MSATAATFIKTLGQVFKFWKKSVKADSLVRFTQSTRVEPITIIDRTVLQQSYLSEVLQSLNAIFAGYYLQAAALTCNVGKIEVGKFLNHLNPDRPWMESHNAALECLVEPAILPLQDYRYGLPSPNRVGLESLPDGTHHAFEADPAQPAWSEDWLNSDLDQEAKDRIAADKAERAGAAAAKVANKDVRDVTAAIYKGRRSLIRNGKKVIAAAATPKHDDNFEQNLGTNLGKDMREATNLSLGRMYTVEISDDGHKASIPVTIRLLTTECDPNLLVHILSDGAKIRTSSAKERWFGYKMKDLSFWRDLVFCTDLIDEHKKALLKDSTGVYAEMLRRRRTNSYAGLATQEPTVGTASNIAIVHRNTIRALEKEIGGKFDNPSVRNKVFEQSYLMIVVVLDPEFDHITFYYRGIALPTELTVRDVKQAVKGSGPDVSDIMRAFQLGSSPSF